MYNKVVRSDFLLLLAAFIWGTTFVAQRKAMDYVGPMTYNALRFALGAVTLLPVIVWLRLVGSRTEPVNWGWSMILGASLAGLALFAGASFQQVGLVYTTAGKAGFITSLYVVIVPFVGWFLGQRYQIAVWVGAILAVAGLFLLSMTESFTVGRGDMLVLISAFFWAAHVLLIGYLAKQANPVRIACMQFFTCSVLSLLMAGLTERVSTGAIRQAAVPILYGGVLSAGVAFTLQVVSQRTCPPAHAAIIMSLETVFAALAGWAILGERFQLQQIAGFTLMLTGFLVVQLPRLLSLQERPLRHKMGGPAPGFRREDAGVIRRKI
jgi:drug/metabolite transporter (DMT)-like permease